MATVSNAVDRPWTLSGLPPFPMDRLITSAQVLRLLDWQLDTRSGELLHLASGERQRLEGRQLQLLLYLASREDEVVGLEELLDQVWVGVIVSPDSVYQAIAALRRTLGDDPRQPRYIATVPRQGYRLLPRAHHVDEPTATMAPTAANSPANSLASPNAEQELEKPADASVAPRPSRRILLGAGLGGLAVLALGGALTRWPGGKALPPARSLAVLPFLDLTDAMDAEPLADGMSEQLIDALGKHPELQVQARSRVFAYKGRDWPASRIGQELGVAQVLEGSVRGDGSQLRINAQLVQVSDGKVRWSASYDRPRRELLQLQSDVAQRIEQALVGLLAG